MFAVCLPVFLHWMMEGGGCFVTGRELQLTNDAGEERGDEWTGREDAVLHSLELLG